MSSSLLSERTRLWLPLGILILFLPILGQGQRILQVERVNSLKTNRFFEGQILTFSLRDKPKSFYQREIVRLYVQENLVQFPDGVVPLDSIAAIRYPGSNSWAKSLGWSMLIFSAPWVVYSILDSLINRRRPADFQYYVGAGAVVGGTTLAFLIPEKRQRFGRRYRLRLLDLTFYPENEEKERP